MGPYNKSLGMADLLILSYDNNFYDKPCMTISSVNGDEMTIVNMIFGKDATQLYDLLRNKDES